MQNTLRSTDTLPRDARFDLRRSDVIIVGGGPAGSVAGILLARAGWCVTLLDRAHSPRRKVCGEYQSPANLEIYRRLGVLDALLEEEHGRIGGAALTGPGLGRAGLFLPYRTEPGLGIPREAMDAVLLRAAERAGVRLLAGWSVRAVLKDHRSVLGVRARRPDGTTARLRARVVLGCDGRNSVVARLLGLRTPPRFPERFALSARITGLPEENIRAIAGMHILRQGFCSVAPLGGGTVNATAVVPAAYLSVIRSQGAEPALRTLLESHTPLWTHVRGRRWKEPVYVLGPLAVKSSRLVADGALVAGDAARFLDPLTGDGIHHALRSGELAAEEIDAALHDGDVSAERLSRYERRHRSEFADRDRFLRVLTWITSRRIPAWLTGTMLRHRPALAEALVATAGGLLPPERLLSFAGLVPHLLGRSSRSPADVTTGGSPLPTL